ncbi:hypothetical protein [Flagellimonas sp.]|uniref:hypothetical protein n=1 Tax=Flagellimonas sp. TaxID=2058762 RepID=UPI003B5ABCC0
MNYQKSIQFLFVLFFSCTLFSQTKEQKPSIKDLDFLIGTWEIQFEFYNTYHPEKGVWFTEKGKQVCYYDLDLNGEPRYIICKGEVTSDSGRFKDRKRTFLEAIRYGNFVDGFERVGLYSNWPGTAKERLSYDSISRVMTIEGELEVRNGKERYEDIYSFDQNHTSYTRKNVANFPDMPITKFNLTVKGTGKKISSKNLD